jgi:hypothetical protein
MRLTIYIEGVQGQEAIDLAYDVQNLFGIDVLATYDIPPNNTEMVIDGHSYRDGDDVESLLRSMGYNAVFDR